MLYTAPNWNQLAILYLFVHTSTISLHTAEWQKLLQALSSNILTTLAGNQSERLFLQQFSQVLLNQIFRAGLSHGKHKESVAG